MDSMEPLPPDAASPAIPLMDPATQAIVDALRSAYEQGGWLAVAGLGLMLFIRIVKMTEAGEAWWDSLQLSVQRAVVFLTGGAGAAIVAVSTGAPLGMALPGAVVAGGVSMFLHWGTKRTGRMLRSTGNPKVDAALRLAFGDEIKDPHPPPATPVPAPAVFSREECPFNYCDQPAPHTACVTRCRYASLSGP